MYRKGTGWTDVKGNHLAQDRLYLRAVVNMVMNTGIS
jgi:hypothetical protein